MGDDIVSSTTEAVTGLVKAVPIYEDLVQPTAKELGTASGQLVRAALAPVRLFVLCGDALEKYVTERLSEKLKGVPPEQIITPSPSVAVPALQALAYTAETEPDLAELYANLLATAMDASRANTAHPCFVELIRQMAPCEARFLQLLPTKSSDSWMSGLHLLHVQPFEALPEAIKVDWEHDYVEKVSYILSSYSQLASGMVDSLAEAHLENLLRLAVLKYKCNPAGVETTVCVPSRLLELYPFLPKAQGPLLGEWEERLRWLYKSGRITASQSAELMDGLKYIGSDTTRYNATLDRIEAIGGKVAPMAYIQVTEQILELTPLGRTFARACIRS